MKHELRPRTPMLALLLLTTIACAGARDADVTGGDRDEPGHPATAAAGAPREDRAVEPGPGEEIDAELGRAWVLRAEDRGAIDDELLRAARARDARLRVQAVRALGRIGDAAALPTLRKALDDRDENVRAEAVFALGSLGGAGALGELEGALSDYSAFVRAAVAQSLTRIESPQAEAMLSQLLQDSQGWVWHVTCLVLAAREGGAGAGIVERLIELSEHPDDRLAESATYALSRLAAPTDRLEFDLRRLARSRLMDMSRSTNPRIREHVAYGLAYPSASGEADTLIRLSKDLSPEVRIRAIRSFAFPGSPLGPELHDALDDSDDRVALAMLQSMSRMRGSEVVRSLIEIVTSDERVWFREHAVAVLTRVDPGQAPEICNALQQAPHARLRRAAAGALLGRRDEASLDCAARLVQDPDPTVRRAALPALAGAPDSLAEALGPWLEPATPADRVALAQTAGWRLADDERSAAERDEALALLGRLRSAAEEDGNVETVVAVANAAARGGDRQDSRGLLAEVAAEDPGVAGRRAAFLLAQLSGEPAPDDAARDIPLEHYQEIARWAASPRAAIVKVERPGFPPGRFTVRLDTERAPLASHRFATLAGQGYYSGRRIERVRPSDSVELFGGAAGPAALVASPAGEPTRDEFAPGTVVMEPSVDDGYESAWFVALDSRPELAGSHTLLGVVVQNLDGVAARLLPDDIVVSVTPYEGDGTEPLPAPGAEDMIGHSPRDLSD